MIEQAMSEISLEREAAITQLMESIGQERSAALVQTLEGVAAERGMLLKTIAQIVIWSDLQAKAMFARVFILSACLFLLYFLLRLVYRYMARSGNLYLPSRPGNRHSAGHCRDSHHGSSVCCLSNSPNRIWFVLSKLSQRSMLPRLSLLKSNPALHRVSFWLL